MNLEDDSSTDLQPGFDRYIYGLACEKYLHLNADRRSWFRSYEALLHNSKAGQQSLRRRFRSVDLLSYRHT